ncbi:MAG: stage II sporulation protein M [Nanoarchaeota archaeon]|nr:stage II sporulation protein M [Nanoarchaeota archaeon]
MVKKKNKKIIKKNDFFKEIYNDNWAFLKKIKNYIWFASLTFLLFALLGFLFPIFFKQEIFSFIKEVTQQIADYNSSQLISYIFLNNLKASFFAILIGIVFGIFPFFMAVANGYLIGFVSRYSVNEEGFLILWRLLPHGIFEIPAVILSIAIGMRLGIDVLKSGKQKGIFKQEFVKAIKTFIFIIIPLLVIAAIIEGFLVYFLK